MINGISRSIFAGISLLVGWAIYVYVVQPSGSFYWNEAAHALKGLLIAEDVAQGDWLSFLYDSYRQVTWPPVHNWLVGSSFLVGGATTEAARSVSLAAFIATAYVVYASGLQLHEKRGDLVGFVAGTLFLFSPGLVTSSAQSMLELPGLLAYALGILTFFWSTRHNSWWPGGIALGLAVVLTYFVKSNYGVLLIAGLTIIILTDARLNSVRLLTWFNIWLIVTLIVAFAVWFAYPPKIASTWDAMVNVPRGISDSHSIDGFLFYPRSIVRSSGTIWMAALYLFALIWSCRYRRDPRIRLLLVLIFLQFLVGQIHHTKADRHILPLFPPLFLCVGFVLAQAVGYCTYNYERTTVPYWLPRAAIFITLVCGLALFVAALDPAGDYDHADLAAFVAEQIEEGDSILLLGSMDMMAPSPPLLDWQLTTEHEVLDIRQSGTVMSPVGDRKLAATLAEHDLPAAIAKPLRATLGRTDTSATLRTFYLGLTAELDVGSHPQLAMALADMAVDDAVGKIILITRQNGQEVYPTTPLASALVDLGFVNILTQKFIEGDLRADIFERRGN